MQFFGYDLTVSKTPPGEKSFVAPQDEAVVDTFKAAGYYGTYVELDASIKSDAELVAKYRNCALQADVDMAVDDIVNEAIANVDQEKPIKLNLEKTRLSKKMQDVVTEEFKNVLDIMEFNTRAQDYFRRWYVDGKIFFHKVIDENKPLEGIKDIRYIDPRKIKKVREIKREKDPKTGIQLIKDIKEFFVYNEQGIWATKVTPHLATQAIRIEKDAIAYCSSGIVDAENTLVYSHLNKALKPANQLRMMENALVIYRLARAPERRIFYVDVGNLPRLKAEQYMRDIMNRYRNKLVYDSSTGEIRDDKKAQAMLEDFWLPRNGSKNGTEISTLPGGENLGQITDIEYFRKILYHSLNVPPSRFQEESGGLNFGKAAEISRDELKFYKFIMKLRKQFTKLFLDVLRTQLMLKNIIVEEDWNDIKEHAQFIYATDAYYEETKQQQILQSRLEVLTMANDFVGVYFSKKWIQTKILRMTDEEIDKLEKEIEKEVESGFVAPQISDVMSSAEMPPPPETAKPKPKPKGK